MDTIHCFFIHTFDTGFRIKTNQFDNIINQDAKNDDDELYEDLTMIKLSNFLKNKREKLRQIRGKTAIKQSKFVTNVTNQNGMLFLFYN